MLKRYSELNLEQLAHSKGYNIGVVYHGTTKSFNVFKNRDIGFHFGTKEQALYRTRESMETKLIPAYISLIKPYDIVSDLGDWTDMEMLEEYLSEANEGPFTEKEFKKFRDVNAVQKGLIDKGYDGLIYENSFEGSGESYIVFSPSQIKLADPVTYDDNGTPIPLSERFNKTNPDIRY